MICKSTDACKWWRDNGPHFKFFILYLFYMIPDIAVAFIKNSLFSLTTLLNVFFYLENKGRKVKIEFFMLFFKLFFFNPTSTLTL